MEVTIITHTELDYGIQLFYIADEKKCSRILRDLGLPANGMDWFHANKGDMVSKPIGTTLDADGRISWTVEPRFKNRSMRTKGEWVAREIKCSSVKYGKHTGFEVWATGGDIVTGRQICNIINDNSVGSSEAEREANARLISAAPDMYYVCKMALNGATIAEIKDRAEAAINKANNKK